MCWICSVQVSRDDGGDDEEAAVGGGDEEEVLGGLDEEDEDAYEWVSIADNVGYLGPMLRLLAFSHTLISFAMLVAYYVLKASAASFSPTPLLLHTVTQAKCPPFAMLPHGCFEWSYAGASAPDCGRLCVMQVPVLLIATAYVLRKCQCF